ncbi:hypothetical protein Tco_1287859 [Tanacetum coccineum]
MVPRAVLMKSGLVSVNTARQVNVAHSKTTVNAARPKSHFSKIAHSTVKRPIYKNTIFKNSNFNQRVNTIMEKNINAARPKAIVNTARPKAVVNVATIKAKTVNGEVQLQALVDGKKSIITESIIRKDLQLEDAEGVDFLPNATIFEQLTLMSSKTTAWNEFSSTMASVPQPSGPTTNVADEAVNEEMNDSLVRAVTTASSFEVEQDNGNINKTQSKATTNEPSSSGTSSSGGPRRQETIRDTIAQTRSKNVSKHSNDLLITRGNILRSGKDCLKLQELMALCTTLQSRVLALETTKTTQANEIVGLKKRVKKLERRNKSRTHGLKILYKVGSSRRVESSRDKEDLGEDASKQRRRIHDIDADEDITLVNNDNEMFDVGTLTGVEVLAEKVVASKDVNLSVDEVTLAQALATLKSAKKKELIRLDEELASKLQAEFDEEAKIKADHELAQRLQAQEQEELSDAEKARLFVQLLEKRRKQFAAKRAEEKRNMPPTRAQQTWKDGSPKV